MATGGGLEFGLTLGIGAREPLSRVAEIARAAEAAGFGRLWFIDVQLSMKDPYAAMLLAAQATERLQVGPGVSNPVTRHPSVIANAIAAVHEVSGGRAVLGLGAGQTAVYLVGLGPMRVADLRGSAARIKALLAGQPVSEHRVTYRLQVVPPGRPPPLFIGATNPRMLELGGAVADGVIVLGAAEPGFVAHQLARVREGARGRDRPPAIDLWLGIALGASETARDEIRGFAAGQARTLSRWKGALPGRLEGFRAELERIDAAYVQSDHLKVRGSNAALVPPELADLIAVAGSPEQCRARLRELHGLGVDACTFTLLSGDRVARIRELGEALVKPLRAAGL